MLEFHVDNTNLQSFGCQSRTPDHAHVFLYESDGAFVTHAIETGLIPRSHTGFIETRPSGKTLEEWANEKYGQHNPETSTLELGVYYPRCYKPLPYPRLDTPQNQFSSAEQQALDAVKILAQRTLSLFETVAPIPAHAEVYSHRIRETLLLACMEVESSWKAILKANAYQKFDRQGNVLNEKQWNTTDYVKLFEPLELKNFHMVLTRYPDWPTFCPFENWDAVQPTQSLDWYNAYNQTKHSREDAFSEAQLRHAIHAVGAAIVLTFLQFGESVVSVIDTMQLRTTACPFYHVPRMKITSDGNGKFIQDSPGYHPMVPGRLHL